LIQVIDEGLIPEAIFVNFPKTFVRIQQDLIRHNRHFCEIHREIPSWIRTIHSSGTYRAKVGATCPSSAALAIVVPQGLVIKQLLVLINVSNHPGGDRVRLTDVSALTFQRGHYTAARRGISVPQLECVGGTASRFSEYHPSTAQCYNKGHDGRDVQWECKAELNKNVRLGRITVSCEGYSFPDDPYVLYGSCAETWQYLNPRVALELGIKGVLQLNRYFNRSLKGVAKVIASSRLPTKQRNFSFHCYRWYYNFQSVIQPRWMNSNMSPYLVLIGLLVLAFAIWFFCLRDTFGQIPGPVGFDEMPGPAPPSAPYPTEAPPPYDEGTHTLATIFEIFRYRYIRNALLLRLLKVLRQPMTGFALRGAHQDSHPVNKPRILLRNEIDFLSVQATSNTTFRKGEFSPLNLRFSNVVSLITGASATDRSDMVGWGTTRKQLTSRLLEFHTPDLHLLKIEERNYFEKQKVWHLKMSAAVTRQLPSQTMFPCFTKKRWSSLRQIKTIIRPQQKKRYNVPNTTKMKDLIKTLWNGVKKHTEACKERNKKVCIFINATTHKVAENSLAAHDRLLPFLGFIRRSCGRSFRDVKAYVKLVTCKQLNLRRVEWEVVQKGRLCLMDERNISSCGNAPYEGLSILKPTPYSLMLHLTVHIRQAVKQYVKVLMLQNYDVILVGDPNRLQVFIDTYGHSSDFIRRQLLESL
ncbi:transmembrane protein 66, partial [Clonorchis sinensis]